MKKRIIALMTALILVMSCMPLPVFAAEKADTSASDTSGIDEADDGADDFARYGTDGEYAIVPCHAGSSSMDSGNGSEFKIWRTHRMNNQRVKLPTTKRCSASIITAVTISFGALKIWVTAPIPFTQNSMMRW